MKCNFCGREISLGKERIFVDKKGQTHYFCSKKCEINLLKLGRKARKVKWTEAYRKEKAIRMKSMKKEKKEPKGEKKIPKKEEIKKKTKDKKEKR